MAPATVSTGPSPKNLLSQSIILIIIWSIVDGSLFPLLNSAMVVATCALLKELLYESLAQRPLVLPPTDVGQAVIKEGETAAALPNIHQTTDQLPPSSAKSPHIMPPTDVGRGVVQEGETAAALPNAKLSKSKYSSQKKPTRDYHPMLFSKSLSVRGSKYIYDTREVKSGDVAPEPIIKNDTTDETAEELIQEPRTKHPHESLEKMTTSTTPPSPPSPSRVKDFAYEVHDTPSRAASTMLAGVFTFIFVLIFSASSWTL